MLPSGSLTVAENVTSSGALPEIGFADAITVGADSANIVTESVTESPVLSLTVRVTL